MDKRPWFLIENIDQSDSPALCFYKERIGENIRRLLEQVPADRLRPHVKTNKTAEVCRMMMDAGIDKFKCATIAEAEMLGMAGAGDVLLAYSPAGPKIDRFLQLIRNYPDTHFTCLADSAAGVHALAGQCRKKSMTADVFIDLNVGMNRTGILPAAAAELYPVIRSAGSLRLAGLHAYDGHIHDRDPGTRKARCLEAFREVDGLRKTLESLSGSPLILVAGGSPTYPIHAQQDDGRECSPGTFIFWDRGYRDGLPDQSFDYAALLICRIISMPTAGTVCVDLGHKSVAAEMPQPRVFFLNAPEAVPVAQSEEHLLLTVPDIRKYSIGQVLYGVPWHICPSVALYDEALVVEDHQVKERWQIIARRRRISI
jgi:D-serine deaminase-like pyridoxal phosphate-dependent protein